jgi:hypothetical protein
VNRVGCQKKSGRSIWECLSEIPQKCAQAIDLKVCRWRTFKCDALCKPGAGSLGIGY